MQNQSYENGLLFSRAHAAVREYIYNILSQYNLTPSYWAILGAVVNSEEGIRFTSIAKQMGVKPPLITMLAKDLIEQGLINRLPHHSDGRAKLLVPTAEGKKLAPIIEEKVSQAIAQLMKGVNSDEALIFQKVLETILHNADHEA
jgi:DNA-binding MarR family transcriptional regulator